MIDKKFSKVFAGSIDHTLRDQTGARISQITKAFPHEQYKGTLYDILVAKLEEPFELSKYIGIITLCEKGMEPKGKLSLPLISIRF